MPTGVTEFQFKVADLNFYSDSYQWLVVAGAKAQYKGVGTINGEGQYKFVLTAIDADVSKTDGFLLDRFRIKIWTGGDDGIEAIVYDNGLGDADTEDYVTTETSAGSIVIHVKSDNNINHLLAYGKESFIYHERLLFLYSSTIVLTVWNMSGALTWRCFAHSAKNI